MSNGPREVFTRLYKGKQAEQVHHNIIQQLNRACSKGVANGYALSFFENTSPNTFVIVAYLGTADNPIGMAACKLETGAQRFGLNRVVHLSLLCSSTPGIGKVLMDVVVDYGSKVLKAEAIVLQAVLAQVPRYKKWGFQRGMPPDDARNQEARHRYWAMRTIANSTANLTAPRLPALYRDLIASTFSNQLDNNQKLALAGNLRYEADLDYPPDLMQGKLYRGNAPELITMYRYLVPPSNRKTTAVSWKQGGRFKIPKNVKTLAYHTSLDKTWIEEKRKKRLQALKRRWSGGNLKNQPVVKKRKRSPSPTANNRPMRSRSPSPVWKMTRNTKRSSSRSPELKIITPTTRATTPRPY